MTILKSARGRSCIMVENFWQHLLANGHPAWCTIYRDEGSFVGLDAARDVAFKRATNWEYRI